MEKYRNWVEMPDELMLNIFQRLNTGDKLNSARKVCTTWRRVCNDTELWKVIDMEFLFDDLEGHFDIERLIKQAVDLSCGELIDISIKGFGDDALLDHVVRRSSKLKRLRLLGCYSMTGSGLSQAVKMLPQLEELCFSEMLAYDEDIEDIGRNCPQLKSFTINNVNRGFYRKCDGDALAIANNMPQLRRLELFYIEMTINGVLAIVNGCPHLELLDVSTCGNLYLGRQLGKLCMERIKDFKFDELQIQDSENDDDMYSSSDVDDFSDSYD